MTFSLKKLSRPMESTPTHESFFVQILPTIKDIKDVNKAKKFLQKYITSSSISVDDKESIIYNLENVKTRGKLDIYLYNSLLYYEGHSVAKVLPKKKRREKRNYFTHETENAILLYNKLEPSNERSRLYDTKIHYPIFKLTQNIIHTFKFYHTEVEDLTHLQHEIEIFLLSKFPLYHHSKSLNDRFNKIINKEFKEYYLVDSFLEYTNNTDKVSKEQIRSFLETLDVSELCMEKLLKLTPPKAYSYFRTITKRWLINYTDKIYNKKLNTSPIQDLNAEDSPLCEPHPNPIVKDQLAIFMDDYVEYVTENIYTLFPKEKDARLADIVLDLFRQREHIKIFNKKALYFEIRDKGDFKTPKITKISEKLYVLFQTNYVHYLEYGYYNFEDS